MITAGAKNTVVLTELPEQQEIQIPAHTGLTLFVPLVGEEQEAQHRIDVVLSGEGAEADVFGVFVGTGTKKQQVTINTIHAARATRGNVRVDAVLGGSSRFLFTGTIHILPGAHESNGELHQHSLLLSNDAWANAIPALEIEANDVKAFHAATAGPLDPIQQFFLMSRGLPEQQAKEYIVRGFVHPVLRLMPEAQQQNIDQRLAALFAHSWTPKQ